MQHRCICIYCLVLSNLAQRHTGWSVGSEERPLRSCGFTFFSPMSLFIPQALVYVLQGRGEGSCLVTCSSDREASCLGPYSPAWVLLMTCPAMSFRRAWGPRCDPALPTTGFQAGVGLPLGRVVVPDSPQVSLVKWEGPTELGQSADSPVRHLAQPAVVTCHQPVSGPWPLHLSVSILTILRPLRMHSCPLDSQHTCRKLSGERQTVS